MPTPLTKAELDALNAGRIHKGFDLYLVDSDLITILAEVSASDVLEYSFEYNLEFSAAQLTVRLANPLTTAGVAKYGAEVDSVIGYALRLREYIYSNVAASPSIYNSFLGIIRQHGVEREGGGSSTISVVALDVLSKLQDVELLNFKMSPPKVQITHEVMRPAAIIAQTNSMVSIFNSMNVRWAKNPTPIIKIVLATEGVPREINDPGFQINYAAGQIVFNSPIDISNFKVLATYYFYTSVMYVEDVIVPILANTDGYSNLVFSADQLSSSYNAETGKNVDALIPNLEPHTIDRFCTLSGTITSSTANFQNFGGLVCDGGTYTLNQITKPTQLTGLQLWVKGDEITGQASGSTITTWSDLSGNGNNLTAVGAPTLQLEQANSKAIVRFGGASDYFTHSTLTLTDFTAFVVSKDDTPATSSAFFGGTSSSYITQTDATNIAVSSESATTGSVGFNALDTAYHTHAFRRTGTTVDVYRDGYNLGQITGITGNFTFSHFGAESDASDKFDGDIAEAVIYNRSFSDRDRHRVDTYLANIYNITISGKLDDSKLLPDSLLTFDSSGYVKVDDEIINYTGITLGDKAANPYARHLLTGVTRGALGTTAVSHPDNSVMYQLYPKGQIWYSSFDNILDYMYYAIDMSDVSGWAGSTITGMRFYPTNTDGATFDIDFINLTDQTWDFGENRQDSRTFTTTDPITHGWHASQGFAGYLGDPRGMAWGFSNLLYIIDNDGGKIKVVDSTGTITNENFITSVGGNANVTTISNMYDIDYSFAGSPYGNNLYVTAGTIIYKINSAGAATSFSTGYVTAKGLDIGYTRIGGTAQAYMLVVDSNVYPLVNVGTMGKLYYVDSSGAKTVLINTPASVNANQNVLTSVKSLFQPVDVALFNNISDTETFNSVLIFSGTYTDQTSNATTLNDGSLVSGMTTTSEYVYIGFDAPFYAVAFNFSTYGAGYSLKVEYYNGSWTQLNAATHGITDLTSNFTADGIMSWNELDDWQKTIPSGSGASSLYWVRLSTTTTPSTQALIDRIIATTGVDLGNVVLILTQGKTDSQGNVLAFNYTVNTSANPPITIGDLRWSYPIPSGSFLEVAPVGTRASAFKRLIFVTSAQSTSDNRSDRGILTTLHVSGASAVLDSSGNISVSNAQKVNLVGAIHAVAPLYGMALTFGTGNQSNFSSVPAVFVVRGAPGADIYKADSLGSVTPFSSSRLTVSDGNLSGTAGSGSYIQIDNLSINAADVSTTGRNRYIVVKMRTSAGTTGEIRFITGSDGTYDTTKRTTFTLTNQSTSLTKTNFTLPPNRSIIESNLKFGRIVLDGPISIEFDFIGTATSSVLTGSQWDWTIDTTSIDLPVGATTVPWFDSDATYIGTTGQRFVMDSRGNLFKVTATSATNSTISTSAADVTTVGHNPVAGPIMVYQGCRLDADYAFLTLQATGIELADEIIFTERSVKSRLEAISQLKSLIPTNYIFRTQGDNKIWASYLNQKQFPDYTILGNDNSILRLGYTQDSETYTRTKVFGQSLAPVNILRKKKDTTNPDVILDSSINIGNATNPASWDVLITSPSNHQDIEVFNLQLKRVTGTTTENSLTYVRFIIDNLAGTQAIKKFNGFRINGIPVMKKAFPRTRVQVVRYIRTQTRISGKGNVSTSINVTISLLDTDIDPSQSVFLFNKEGVQLLEIPPGSRTELREYDNIQGVYFGNFGVDYERGLIALHDPVVVNSNKPSGFLLSNISAGGTGWFAVDILIISSRDEGFPNLPNASITSASSINNESMYEFQIQVGTDLYELTNQADFLNTNQFTHAENSADYADEFGGIFVRDVTSKIKDLADYEPGKFTARIYTFPFARYISGPNAAHTVPDGVVTGKSVSFINAHIDDPKIRINMRSNTGSPIMWAADDYGNMLGTLDMSEFLINGGPVIDETALARVIEQTFGISGADLNAAITALRGANIINQTVVEVDTINGKLLNDTNMPRAVFVSNNEAFAQPVDSRRDISTASYHVLHYDPTFDTDDHGKASFGYADASTGSIYVRADRVNDSTLVTADFVAQFANKGMNNLLGLINGNYTMDASSQANITFLSQPPPDLVLFEIQWAAEQKVDIIDIVGGWFRPKYVTAGNFVSATGDVFQADDDAAFDINNTYTLEFSLDGTNWIPISSSAINFKLESGQTVSFGQDDFGERFIIKYLRLVMGEASRINFGVNGIWAVSILEFSVYGDAVIRGEARLIARQFKTTVTNVASNVITVADAMVAAAYAGMFLRDSRGSVFKISTNTTTTITLDTGATVNPGGTVVHPIGAVTIFNALESSNTVYDTRDLLTTMRDRLYKENDVNAQLDTFTKANERAKDLLTNFVKVHTRAELTIAFNPFLRVGHTIRLIDSYNNIDRNYFIERLSNSQGELSITVAYYP